MGQQFVLGQVMSQVSVGFLTHFACCEAIRRGRRRFVIVS